MIFIVSAVASTSFHVLQHAEKRNIQTKFQLGLKIHKPWNRIHHASNKEPIRFQVSNILGTSWRFLELRKNCDTKGLAICWTAELTRSIS